MKKYTYNFEIRDLLTQFVAAFDDTVIKRYDKDGNAEQNIEVRYVMAPKQRIMYDIVNKAQNLKLPVVSIDLASVSYDNDRVFNKLSNFDNYPNPNSSSAIRTPVPVNLEVNMSIMCRYMQDMEQILSNFIPYSNPYVVLAWKEPTSLSGGDDVEIRSEVLWNQSISMNTPTDTTYSEKFRTVADTAFTIKGWMFRNKNEQTAPIYFIENNFINTAPDYSYNAALTSLDYESFFNDLSSVAETETITLSGIPDITNIFFNASGTMIETVGATTLKKNVASLDKYSYTIIGGNFEHTEFVMLSSSGTTMTDTLTTVETPYTGSVTGYLLDDSAWQVMSDAAMNITFPYLSGSGNLDLIIKTPAGWKSSSEIDGFYFIAD